MRLLKLSVNDPKIWGVKSEFLVFVFLLGNKMYLVGIVESQSRLVKWTYMITLYTGMNIFGIPDRYNYLVSASAFLMTEESISHFIRQLLLFVGHLNKLTFVDFWDKVGLSLFLFLPLAHLRLFLFLCICVAFIWISQIWTT